MLILVGLLKKVAQNAIQDIIISLYANFKKPMCEKKLLTHGFLNRKDFAVLIF